MCGSASRGRARRCVAALVEVGLVDVWKRS